MDTAVINIKVQPELKKQAQKVANDMGISLSSVIKRYLKQFIKTKTVEFSTSSEEPTEYLIQMLKESEEDIKAGRVSPTFSNVQDALAWLDKPESEQEYEYQLRQNVQQTVQKGRKRHAKNH
jgi:addiction module RelB/DinJ family antitoxin